MLLPLFVFLPLSAFHLSCHVPFICFMIIIFINYTKVFLFHFIRFLFPQTPAPKEEYRPCR